MKIDEPQFRAVLSELIDTNPIACRAVLSICKIEFTETVPTLCVTLGHPTKLRVNLAFIAEHCQSESEVHALLIHEFLHVILRHTTRFKRMTPAINLALDAVINAIIHRRLGSSYSDFFARYYAKAEWPIHLLRSFDISDDYKSNDESQDLDRLELHMALYDGNLVSDDVLDICRQVDSDAITRHLEKGGQVLIGGHDSGGLSIDDLEPDVADRILAGLQAIDGDGIWRNPGSLKPSFFDRPKSVSAVPPEWRKATLPVLQRLILPDSRSAQHQPVPHSFQQPVLNAGDRRGALRALWNPLIPEIAWTGYTPQPIGTVQIYLDVSGSMESTLQALVHLLHGLRRHIRMPFWAFSTEVFPAKIRNGRLETTSTGGTELECVIAHLKQTRPRKALIITDGFVEDPRKSQKSAHSRYSQIEALVPPGGTSDVLRKWGIPVTVLPVTLNQP